MPWTDDPDDPPELSTAHRRSLVEESGISVEVVRERGYRTETVRARLTELGFSRNQSRVPALLIPVHTVHGEIGLYQARPDRPRIVKGKSIKYETPYRSRMVLDCHPAVRSMLGDPTIPLLVTEGVKKGDALVSRGCVAVALIGVWNFRGTNAAGGKVMLPDWESIALNGRDVVVVFDSDVMRNPQVHGALSRLAAILRSRDARVSFVYLPAGPHGAKVGVDDFLAVGHTVEDLRALETCEVQPLAGVGEAEYEATSSGLVWNKPGMDGPVPVPLANFTAQMVADITEDDGVEPRHLVRIEGELNGRSVRAELPTARFTAMTWPIEEFGVDAILEPGFGTRDRARTAIQKLSPHLEREHVYTHTGWCQIDDQWVFLSASGPIGPDGPVHGIDVRLPEGLHTFNLPAPPNGTDLRAAVDAVRSIVGLAPAHIIFPLLAAVFRAALGPADFSVHVVGPTGAGKTEVVACMQQFYGMDMDARHLPASWTSTSNALEALTFSAKDVVLVIDDFAPSGTVYDMQRQHSAAERVFRAQGNQAGRARMRADTSLRAARWPRGVVLSTGEDVPRGQSVRARMLVLELAPGDVAWDRLSQVQMSAREGVLARCMAAFVHWLAPQYAEVKRGLREAIASRREAIYADRSHQRTPEIVASLEVAMTYFVRFARETGAVDTATADEIEDQAVAAIREAAGRQGAHLVTSDPANRFIELLGEALMGGYAHLSTPDGECPAGASAWGWRYQNSEFHPRGVRVGFVEADRIYLLPDISFQVVQQIASGGGDPLMVTPRTLRKRLKEHGFLAASESGSHLTVRRMFCGRRERVLAIPIPLITGTGPSGPTGPTHA